MPPLISWGYCRRRSAAPGMPTLLSISTASRSARARETTWCRRMASQIWLPIVWTGLKAVIGSWKIMLISPPRRW